MNGWRQKLLSAIPIHLHRLLFVYDHDDILSDEELLSFLHEKDVGVITMQDRAELRVHYEEHLDNSKGKWIYRYVGEGPFTFPFDMLHDYGTAELTIHQAFPTYSLPVLRQLDHDVLDALYQASDKGQKLSNQETCDYLLKWVYKLHYETIETEIEWISFLIQLHDHRFSIPKILKEYIIAYLEAKDVQFRSLFDYIHSKTKFINFLQEQWNEYVVTQLHQGNSIRERSQVAYQQATILSFESIRGLLQPYFIEGRLIPVEVDCKEVVPLWAKHGVKQKAYQPLEDIHHLKEKIKLSLEEEKIHYKNWIQIIILYSKMKVIQLHYRVGQEIVKDTEQTINAAFKEWMIKHYRSLASFSAYVRPVMVHHILPHMQFNEEQKQALLVLDGMSFVQWKQIKAALDPSFVIEENGVFAWVPTITEISRKAIFHAEIPKFQSTLTEEKGWKQFWNRGSIHDLYITFENYLAQGAFDETQYAALQKKNAKKAAIILRNIDTFTHGAIQGLEGMYAEVDVWLKTNYLNQLLSKLLEDGYSVYLTSDHGNTESVGIGRPKQGALVETKGERVRIYNDPFFRNEAADRYPSIVWSNDALSEKQYYLLAENGTAFVPLNEQIVSHGGITIEEVIVPFIKIKKR